MDNLRDIHIIIADDHDLYRDGLSALLRQALGTYVAAEASNGRALVDLTRRLKPDVVLTDLQMPGMSGIEAIKEIAALKLPSACIALTNFDTDSLVLDAIAAGAGLCPEKRRQAGRAGRGARGARRALLLLPHDLDPAGGHHRPQRLPPGAAAAGSGLFRKGKTNHRAHLRGKKQRGDRPGVVYQPAVGRAASRRHHGENRCQDTRRRCHLCPAEQPVFPGVSLTLDVGSLFTTRSAAMVIG